MLLAFRIAAVEMSIHGNQASPGVVILPQREMQPSESRTIHRLVVFLRSLNSFSADLKTCIGQWTRAAFVAWP